MRVRGVLLVAAVLLACGVAAWFALRPVLDRPVPDRPVGPTVAARAAETQDDPTDEVDEAPEAAPEPPPPPREVVIHVTDRDSRRVIAVREVEVTIDLIPGPAGGQPVVTTLRATTDASGRLRVRVPHAVRGITVQSGGRVAHWSSYAGAGPPAQLAARLAPAIPVQVVTADGRPAAGVRVLLEVENEGQHPPRSTLTDDVTRAPDGVARLVVPVSGRVRARQADGSLFVSLGIPLPHTVSAPIELDAVPDAPVRLVMPETGRVEVAVIDHDQRPFEGDANAILTDGGEVSAASGLMHWQAAPVRDGLAVFPHVGVGLTLNVRAHPSDQTLLGGVVRFAGPIRVGQTVNARVALGRPKPVFTGRLLDARRQPMPSGYVSATLLSPYRSPLQRSGRHPSASTRCDETGRFRLAFATEAPYEASFTLQIDGVATPLRFPESIEPHPVELGDVVLDENPVLAAGRVVGQDARPIRDAALSLERQRADETWVLVRDMRAYANEKGEFVLRGTAADGKLRLRISSAQHYLQPAQTEFWRGERGVLVSLVVPGALLGSVTMPPGTTSVPVRVFAEGDIAMTGERTADGRVGGAIVRPDGGFELSRLRPGLGTVAIYLEGREEPIERIENVEVVSGERREDGRLRLIDIRGHIASRTITVADAKGNSLTDATVWSRPANTPLIGHGGWFWQEQRADPKGRVRVPVGASPLHVLAHGRGHGWAEVLEMRDDTTVKLPPKRAGRVVVRLADDVSHPEPPLRYTVTLSWAGTRERVVAWLDGAADPRSRAMMNRPYGKDGTATFEVPGPGRYRAHLTLFRDTPQGGAGFPVRPADLRGVVVDAGEEPVELIFRPDPETLAEALRKHEARE